MYAMPRTDSAMFDTMFWRCCTGTVMNHRNVPNNDSAIMASIAFSPR